MGDLSPSRRFLVVHWDGADESVLRPLLNGGHLPALNRLLREGIHRPLRAKAGDAPSLWSRVVSGDGAAPWWNRAREAQCITHVVGWPYGGPAREEGVTVAPAFARSAGNAVHPPAAQEELTAYRIAQGEITPELLATFAPALAEPVDRLGSELRRPLRVLAHLLASTASLHAAATALLERSPWDAAVVHYGDLAHFRARFDRFRAGSESPAPDTLRRWLGDVVEGAFRFHDMMLERLLELAGTHATVLLIVLPHVRPLTGEGLEGFVCVRPPSSVLDGPLSPSDVVPLIADVSQLPLTSPAEGETESATPRMPEQPVARFQYAHALLARGNNTEALPILAALYADSRLPAHGMQLLRCQLRLKRPNDARATLNRLLSERALRLGDEAEAAPLPPQFSLLQAKVLYAEQSYREAYASLQAAEADAPETALFYRRLGAVYLQLRAWPDAERVFRHALMTAPRFPAAHRWLSVALIRQGKYEEALVAATRAAELRDPFPAAHYHRAIALLRLGRPAEAAEAAETSLAQQPEFDRARFLLTQLYRDHLDQPAKAMEHLLASPPPAS